MQEKRNDQSREVVGSEYSQGDQDEENHSRPGNDVFDQCESSQDVEKTNAEDAAGQTSRSDNVQVVQSLPTVPSERPKKTKGSGSTSRTISQAVSESTGQNPMTKTVPVQPSEKDTKARSFLRISLVVIFLFPFFGMLSDEIESMYVCRSLQNLQLPRRIQTQKLATPRPLIKMLQNLRYKAH